MVTAEDFVQLTGYIPHQDDLDRANCPEAGEDNFGHWGCGVCPGCNRIRWNVCVCQPRITPDRAFEIVNNTNEARSKVLPWLAKVNELLAAKLGPEAKWSNTGSNDHWHDAYDEDQSPEDAVFPFTKNKVVKWDPAGNTLEDLKQLVSHQTQYTKEFHIILLEDRLWCIEQMMFNRNELLKATCSQVEVMALHLAQLGARYNFLEWALYDYCKGEQG